MRLQRDEYEYTVFIYTDYTCMRKANTVSVFDDLDTLQPRFQRISSKTSEVCVCGGVACRGRHRRAPVQQHMPRAFPRAGRVGQAEGHLRPVACRGRHRRAPVQSTCHGPFLERGVSVGRKVTCRPVVCRGRHRRAPVQSTCHGPFLERGVSFGRKVTWPVPRRAGRHKDGTRRRRGTQSLCALAICRRRRIRRWPGLWRRASCQPVACRERHRRVPVQRHKPRASVERGVSAAGHLQGWALGPACPSPAAVYSDLKKQFL
jgi:hypothetical protein